ncbi:7TM diverse intracellular signaling domain-containing protein [Cohnella cellulosilytica]|uniref:histidine kinase n=2 Tax=Cohnella cellulosilytica TaxID=986710 RepID=A0ABW2F6U6_9BACL
MDVLADEEGRLTFADVQTAAVAERFQPAEGKSAFGLTAGTYWVRTSVVNHTSRDQWVIRVNNSVIEQFSLYVFDKHATGASQSGILEKVNEHFTSYYIHLPADVPVDIYIRCKINGSMIIPIELMDNGTFLGKLKHNYVFFGIYYGFVLMMAAYMLSMFIFNRIAVYFYYSMYILCFSISQLVWNGLLKEFLGEENRAMTFLLRVFGNYEGIDYFFFISCLWFGLLFLGQIWQLRTYAPRMFVVYRLLNIVSPLVLVASLLHWPGYATMAILYESLFALLLVVSTVWCIWRGNLAARYVILAAIPFLGFAAPTILNTYSLMQESFLTHYGFQIGSIAEYVMFAIALSYQLRQARMDKERALRQNELNEQRHQTRNELLQNISHDIRSPLAVVQGGIRAILHGIEIEPEAKARFLNTLYDKVLYINKFIDDLFELSSLERSPPEIATLETIPFADWIRREFESSSATIRMADLHEQASVLVDSATMVSIHSHEISRVLANLVHNACKFSPIGGTVRLQANSENGEVLVCVEDEGEGMAPEYLETIFNRAVMIDPASKLSGSGIGLAIAKEIVERHKGSIWAESQPGQGSRFCFKLPANVPRPDSDRIYTQNR